MYLNLDLQLTEEQRAFRESVHRFAAGVLRPRAAEFDRCADAADVIARSCPLWDVLRQAYRLSYHRVMVPAEVGGLGCSGLEQHLFLEELGWGSADFAIAIGVAGLSVRDRRPRGEPRAGRRARAALRGGHHGPLRRLLGHHRAGSRVGHARRGSPEFHDPRIRGNYARRDGDDHVLSGQKLAWVSSGTIATHALTFLSLDPRQGMAGGGVAVVPLDLPGVSREAAREDGPAGAQPGRYLAAPPTGGAGVRGAA